MLVSLGLDQHIEDLAFRVDGAPKIEHSAIDFQIDLVEAPSRVRLPAALSQVSGDHRSEMIHPTSDCLVGHRHSALGEQIFDIMQARREPAAEPNRLLNALGREPVAGLADFHHALWLPRSHANRNIASM